MSDQESKIERGTLSPKHPLEEALSFAKSLDDAFGGKSISRESIAEAFGHSPASSTAGIKIGTLTHFGLLRRAGNVYSVSPLASQLLRPKSDSEYRQALKSVAQTPSLYRRLFAEFAGRALPTMLDNILQRDFGVARANAAEVTSTFKKTAEFAGLLENGVLASASGIDRDGGIDSSVSPSAIDNPPKPRDESSPSPLHVLRVDSGSFGIPLSRGKTATLVLPRPISTADLSRIKSWIDLMGDVLCESPENEMPETS